jgi:hypothetical protein
VIFDVLLLLDDAWLNLPSKWVLTYNQEVRGSNLRSDTDHYDIFFVFLSVTPGRVGIVVLIKSVLPT